MVDSIVAGASALPFLGRRNTLAGALQRFFGRRPHDLPIVSRHFPAVDLPNVQAASEGYARERGATLQALGYTGGMVPMQASLRDTVGQTGWFMAVRIGPVHCRMVDVDVDRQMPWVESGLFLITTKDGKIAANVGREAMFSRGSLDVDAMAVSEPLAVAFLEGVQRRAAQSSIYRGKVISLEGASDPRTAMAAGRSAVSGHDREGLHGPRVGRALEARL